MTQSHHGLLSINDTIEEHYSSNEWRSNDTMVDVSGTHISATMCCRYP